MSDQRPTPETDELLNTIRKLECELAEAAKARDHNRTCVKRLTQERDEARGEATMWKANHDNQVRLKATLMDRPDLGDRARKVVSLAKERDEARERERVAIASWDEERERSLRESQRVVEARGLVRELRDALTLSVPHLEAIVTHNEALNGCESLMDRADLRAIQSALAKAKEVLPKE